MVDVELVSIEWGNCELCNPVAKDYEFSTVWQRVLLVYVAVSDDKVVGVGMLLCKLADECKSVVFVFWNVESLILDVFAAAVPCPKVAPFKPPAWVERSEKFLAYLVTEDEA